MPGKIKKVFRIVRNAFLVIAVFVAVLVFYNYFTSKNKIQLDLSGERTNNDQIYKTINDPQLNSTKGGKLLILTYRSLLCGTVGEACTNNPKDANKYYDRSLFGQITALLVVPYANPPASGVYWAYSGLQNAGFVPKTFAFEGVGFAALKPIENLWKIFRDFSFLLIVIVLIAIGFMIMFRVKINPQTVISLENSLPRIVVVLFLVTFSFAIAGFFIDLMYAIIVMAISLIAKVNLGSVAVKNLADLQNKYVGAGLTQLWPYQQAGNPFEVGVALVNILPNFINVVLKGLIALVVTNFFARLFSGQAGFFFDNIKNIGGSGGALTFAAGFQIGNLPGWITWMINLFIFFLIYPYGAGILVTIIFIFTLVGFLFRVFFMLFAAYLKILLLIIFAPVILLIGAFPGSKTISFWFKNLMAELSIFPAVIVLILIGNVLVLEPLKEGGFFRPPFLYNIDPNTFAVLLGTGIILLIPNLIKKMKELLFGIKPGAGLGFNAGLFFGGITGVAGAAEQQLSRFYYLTQIKDMIGKWRKK